MSYVDLLSWLIHQVVGSFYSLSSGTFWWNRAFSIVLFSTPCCWNSPWSSKVDKRLRSLLRFRVRVK